MLTFSPVSNGFWAVQGGSEKIQADHTDRSDHVDVADFVDVADYRSQVDHADHPEHTDHADQDDQDDHDHIWQELEDERELAAAKIQAGFKV